MILAVDTETTGLSAWHGHQPFMVTTCDVQSGKQRLWEWPVNPFTRKVQYGSTVKSLRKLLENPKHTTIYHNAKFDVRMFEVAMGIKVGGVIEDTLFASHAVNNLEPSHGLKALGQRYLKIPADDEADLKLAVQQARRQGKQLGWKLGEDSAGDYWMPKAVDTGSELCARYCLRDTERTALLWMLYQEALTQEKLWSVYEQEMDLWRHVYAMEAWGVGIDRKRVLAERAAYEVVKAENYAAMEKLVGMPFNPRSQPQMLDILKYQFGLRCSSVDRETLSPMKQEPIVHHLIQYRAADKAIGSFYDNYLENMVPDPRGNGKGWGLHSSFNQVGPRTGRFSCSNPNLQNAANATTSHADRPLQVRGPLGPRKGYTWVLFDYSQLELKVFAALANEETMLTAIRAGRDLPTECANRAWGGKGNPSCLQAGAYALGVSLGRANVMRVRAGGDEDLRRQTYESLPGKSAEEKVGYWLNSFGWDIVAAEASLGSKTKRTQAKTILYERAYGGGTRTLAHLLGVSLEEATGFAAEYDRAFPTIPRFIKDMSVLAESQGYVVNAYGRRLYVDPGKPYKGCNYCIQSTAADMLKVAMIRTAEYLEDTNTDGCTVMTVHDELVYEIRKGQDTLELLCSIRDLMEHVADKELDVPITVKCEKAVKSWAEKEDVELPR